MSYKLGQLPSPGATRSENADFLEVQCFLSAEGSYSIVEAAQALGIVNDEEDNRIEQELSFFDVLSIIDERQRASNGNYPFVTDGYSVCINHECPKLAHDIYIYLLFATRHYMGETRVIEGLDGTALFEKLCAEVLKKYFGESSYSFVFGTGDNEHASFDDKIKNLISQLKEPKYAMRRPEGDTRHQRDDKLDVVAHIPFNDKRMGQFIAFAQCKTGDSWKTSIGLLKPSDFSKNYFDPVLNFTPITVNMVSESFSNDWERIARDVVFFDRCRLMRFLPDAINPDLEKDINRWTNGVMQLMQNCIIAT